LIHVLVEPKFVYENVPKSRFEPMPSWIRVKLLYLFVNPGWLASKVKVRDLVVVDEIVVVGEIVVVVVVDGAIVFCVFFLLFFLLFLL